MLARWQRYQAAKALYAWRVAVMQSKEDQAKARRQQQALAGCRVGFSPSRSPLAGQFEGLALTDGGGATPPLQHSLASLTQDSSLLESNHKARVRFWQNTFAV